ncbi:uncharacterized protein ACBT44_001464 isoform 2-T2 [Syngnathus typhle]
MLSRNVLPVLLWAATLAVLAHGDMGADDSASDELYTAPEANQLVEAATPTDNGAQVEEDYEGPDNAPKENLSSPPAKGPIPASKVGSIGGAANGPDVRPRAKVATRNGASKRKAKAGLSSRVKKGNERTLSHTRSAVATLQA